MPRGHTLVRTEPGPYPHVCPQGLHDTLLLQSALFSLLVMGGEVHVGSHRPTAGTSGPTAVAVSQTAQMPNACPAPLAPDTLAGRKMGYHLLGPANPTPPSPVVELNLQGPLHTLGLWM